MIKILMVFVAFIYARASAATTSNRMCYSCMSKLYGDNWDTFNMGSVYLKPLTFNNLCKDPQGQAAIETAICSGNCVTMTESLNIGAGKPTEVYIRGCYDKIFTQGFNKTLDKYYRQRNVCNSNTTLATLTQDSTNDNQNKNKYMKICTCDSSACTGGQASIFSSQSLAVAIISALAMIIHN